MGAEYEIWLDDAFGRRMKVLDRIERMNAVKATNNIGAIVLTLPPLYDSYVKLDGIIEVWRKPEGGAMKMFNAYLTRTLDYIDNGGVDTTVLGGVDGNDLLNRRIVAYAAGTTNTEMNTYADDIMKTVFTENCVTGASDTARDWSPNFITCDPNTSTGQSISMAFAYRNVLELCQDLADASRVAGTRLYFNMVPFSSSDNTLGWNFTTSPNQPGVDHSGTDMVIFGPNWGNLEGAQISFDHTEEKTYVYSAGQGTQGARTIEAVSDSSRLNASPWNRIEYYYNCSGQASDTAQVYAAGQAKLNELRPRMTFTGTLKDTPAARFGLDWDYGDKIVVEYRGFQYEAIVTSVELGLDGSGNESIIGGFEIISGGGSLSGITAT